ncbi:hypothetical protein TSAR_001373 [Trichomalopsis sarcophagae]|uniref:Uncharacterized protein n=1 Tax=Trichomalopsis sarcophagae TaxID=543379 RepID=A0A232EZ82_9HYME|nr:hypothetical protein TSAR_001373 [Trichomalopsis sarcophagae]
MIPGDDVDTVYPGHQETTLMLPTLGTGYLEERCRRDIRVQRPQKPPSDKTRHYQVHGVFTCHLNTSSQVCAETPSRGDGTRAESAENSGKEWHKNTV